MVNARSMICIKFFVKTPLKVAEFDNHGTTQLDFFFTNFRYPNLSSVAFFLFAFLLFYFFFNRLFSKV